MPIDYTSGVPHTTGAPTHDPGTYGGKVAYDKAARILYRWVSGTTWEVYPSGGGGGGSDYLGTGFDGTGGGHGFIPGGTQAEPGGTFEISVNPNGGNYPNPTDTAFGVRWDSDQKEVGVFSSDGNSNQSFWKAKNGLIEGSVQKDSGDITTINISGESLVIDGNAAAGDSFTLTADYSGLSIESLSPAGDGGKIEASKTGARMYFTSAALGTAFLNVTGARAEFQGPGTWAGLRYNADWSANYLGDDRAIPDLGTMRYIAQHPEQLVNQVLSATYLLGTGAGIGASATITNASANWIVFSVTVGVFPTANADLVTISMPLAFPLFPYPVVNAASTAATNDWNKFKFIPVDANKWKITMSGLAQAGATYSFIAHIMG